LRAPEPSGFEHEFPGGSESANAGILALVRTGGASVALLDKALSHHGLSAAGRQALAVIDGAGHPLSPTAISERLVITTASMTSLLDTLERRGLVDRMPDPRDRRRLLISLTAEGQRTVDAFLPEVVALQTAVMSSLSETERRRFLRSLATIREAIDAVDVESVLAAVPRRVRQRRR
jgi:DNA-binding MarR family transcriptional regulator